jgi:predicted nucleic-acid-binding Zn-ribbon protein
MITPGKDGQMQQQIEISKTSAINCEKCENSTFKQSLLLRRLSALVAPSGQETLVPVQVFACEKCGNVNSEFSDISSL